MSRVSPYPGARAYEEFRQRTVQRFTNFQREATNHVIGRNQAVAEVLGFLSLMRNANLFPPAAKLQVDAARFQTIRGRKTDATEAAHTLPGQLSLMGHAQPLEALIPSARARQRVQALFGHVTILPACFNRADTAAERVDGGLLAHAFRDAAQAAIDAPRAATQPETRLVNAQSLEGGTWQQRWPISRPTIRLAYQDLWLPRAQHAYHRAREIVATSGMYLSDHDDPDTVIAALTCYLHDHRTQPSRLMDPQLDQIVECFHDNRPAAGSGAVL